MKLPKGAFNSSDFAKEAINAIDETTLVTLYSNPEENELAGILIEFNEKQCRKSMGWDVLNALGVTENTLLFFEKASDEEKKKLQTLAMIAYHTKELEKLNQELA